MIPGFCDKETRLAARLYSALRGECPCCTAYRFALLFGVAGFLGGLAAARYLLT